MARLSHTAPHPIFHPEVILDRVAGFIKSNIVFCIAAVAALATTILVPPDSVYAGYFDLRTLTCLLCTSAVVAALSGIGFFRILAQSIIRRFKSLRMSVLALVWITFIGSMVIANDMALLTFLPLGYHVLENSGGRRFMGYTFILQNIAANLGGMLTPFGNPQNLYIYSKFEIPTMEFMSVMAPPFILAVIMITILCVVLPAKPLELSADTGKLPVGRSVFYLVLFALAIVVVFRAIPYYAGLAVIIAALMVTDRRAIAKVDWGLLGTFCAFFIFSGNLARVGVVREFFSALLEKNVMLVSIFSCQFISNVPSAVLLSQFTENWRELLLGVNLGGTGTLIASLASLITFREYTSRNPGKGLAYLGLFSAMNFGFLAVLTVFMLVIG
ncbi:MAG: citrate transporter [Clostridia bacterium]|nr:citrate transporter [Clostridia bacterium]